MAAKKTWTPDMIYDLLEGRYRTAVGWEVLREVRNAAGFDASRSLDVVAINTWPSKHRVVGLEIKVTRHDFQRELAHPEKLDSWSGLLHELWIVAPPGIVDDPSVLPVGVGLYETWGTQKLKKVRQAAYDRHAKPDTGIWISALRRAGDRMREALLQEEKSQELLESVAGLMNGREVSYAHLIAIAKRLGEDRWRWYRDKDEWKSKEERVEGVREYLRRWEKVHQLLRSMLVPHGGPGFKERDNPEAYLAGLEALEKATDIGALATEVCQAADALRPFMPKEE